MPPVSVADSRYGPSTEIEDPAGWGLMRHYGSRQRGVAVFKMSDGTYRIARPVPGLSVPVEEPYPATPEFAQNGYGGVVNDALAWSWVFEQGTEYPLPTPTVSIVYYGGVNYQVSSAEAAALTAAGFGAYLH